MGPGNMDIQYTDIHRHVNKQIHNENSRSYTNGLRYSRSQLPGQENNFQILPLPTFAITCEPECVNPKNLDSE